MDILKNSGIWDAGGCTLLSLCGKVMCRDAEFSTTPTDSALVSNSVSSLPPTAATTTTMKTADMARSVDLVIAFTAAKKTTVSSAQTRKEAQRAQRQYDQLLNTLTYNHLHAVGRRGESLGHLLVFISCPREVLDTLVRKER